MLSKVFRFPLKLAELSVKLGLTGSVGS